ncbi:MAG: methionyl-tRNA formyltransferase [Planctomycetota bacterium]
MSDDPVLRVLFMGTPDAAVPTLRAIRAAGHDVPLVVTRPDRRKGRGKTLSACPVKLAAEELGLAVFSPENVNSLDSVDRLRSCEADVLLIVAYGRILKQSVLDVPRLLPLNLHFSLLPEYRGAAPVAAAIAAGQTTTGVTIQRVVKKLDAGPVLFARETDIEDGETTDELEARLADVGADLTLEALERLAAGTATETPQDHDRATFAPMLAKADGDTDFARPADEIVNHVRAMYSWPGAQAVFAGAKRSKEMPVTLVRTRPGAAEDPFRGPGEVIEVTNDAIVVQTGRGTLSILSLKPAGKREQTAAEFANGYHVAPGDRFQSPIRRS